MKTKGLIEELIDFFTPYFPSRKEAEEFVLKCEHVPEQEHNAMLMLHQTQRLAMLADEIYKIKQRDPLRLLFLMICAEAVAKLYKNYKGQGQSKPHIKIFFNELCNPENLNYLKKL